MRRSPKRGARRVMTRDQMMAANWRFKANPADIDALDDPPLRLFARIMWAAAPEPMTGDDCHAIANALLAQFAGDIAAADRALADGRVRLKKAPTDDDLGGKADHPSAIIEENN